MRIGPSALETSGIANHYSIAHGESATTCNAVPGLGSANQNGGTVSAQVSSGLTLGQGSQIRATNDSAFFAWSAEL